MSLETQLHSLGGFLKDTLEMELISARKEARGVLIKSLNFQVNKTVFGYELVIIGEDYAKYVDQGVRGSRTGSRAPNSPYKYTNKMPPLEPLIRWVEAKALASGDRAVLQAAWAIRKKIFREGVSPTGFIQKGINQASGRITDHVEQGAFKDVEFQIDTFIKERIGRDPIIFTIAA